MQHQRTRSAGFTLVELLVVISIIALLAGFGLTKLMSARRTAEKAACEENLRLIYSEFTVRDMKRGKKGGMPTKVSGSDFVLSIWGNPLEKSEKNSEIFFCPSQKVPDLEDEEIDELTGDLIHYAGRNQADKEYRVTRISNKGATEKVIVCDKPFVDGQEPHAGECLCVLYLSGHTEQFERDLWGEDEEMSIGESSPVEALQGLIGAEGEDY